MSFLGWVTLCGLLLLAMALSSAYIRRLPVSTAAIYLAFGLAIGPLGFEWIALDFAKAAPWLERLAEIAIAIALFVGGLKLRLPLRHPAWSAAFRLAAPLLLLTIAGVAAVAHWLLGVPWPYAMLLGAILAPTDPVLAGTVTVNDAGDEDRMRYGLSGEAGLNDGMAFPFVLFALAWIDQGEVGGWVGPWALQRIVWGVPVALVLGFFLGRGVGRLAIWLRSHHRDTNAPSDLLALALIALAYVAAEWIGALGFLSVFAAGVGLRHAEMRVVARTPHPEHAATGTAEDASAHPPAEQLVPPTVEPEALKEPAVAAGVLVSEAMSFGDAVERVLEVALVVVVGVFVATHWDPRALLLGGALIVIVRPLGSAITLARSPTTGRQRWLMGWFGIRGIGSLYYLAYALDHGVAGRYADTLVDFTITTVAMSIVLHGMSAQPLLARYERALARRCARAEAAP